MILTPLQKLHKNGEDWGKLIVATGFKRLPKVQNIAQSGHTVDDSLDVYWLLTARRLHQMELHPDPDILDIY